MDEHLSTGSLGTACRFALLRILIPLSAPLDDGKGSPMCDTFCTTRRLLSASDEGSAASASPLPIRPKLA